MNILKRSKDLQFIKSTFNIILTLKILNLAKNQFFINN